MYAHLNPFSATNLQEGVDLALYAKHHEKLAKQADVNYKTSVTKRNKALENLQKQHATFPKNASNKDHQNLVNAANSYIRSHDNTLDWEKRKSENETKAKYYQTLHNKKLAKEKVGNEGY